MIEDKKIEDNMRDRIALMAVETNKPMPEDMATFFALKGAPTVKTKLAARKDLTVNTLRVLMKDRDADIRSTTEAKVIEMSELPSDLAISLAERGSAETIAKLIGREDVAAEALDVIVKRGEKETLLIIIKHKNIGKRTLVELANSKEADIAAAALDRLIVS